MKNRNKKAVITSCVCLLPVLLSIPVYGSLPQQVAIHFNSEGIPDNYVPKILAAFGIPMAAAFLNFLMHTFSDKYTEKTKTPPALTLVLNWIVPFITLLFMPVTLFAALGMEVPVRMLTCVTIGLLFTVIGNFLPKCRQNRIVGIKLPWTLKSEENWKKTHHLAGYFWVIGGVFMIAGGFLDFKAEAVLSVVFLFLLILPMLYSYCLAKKGI